MPRSFRDVVGDALLIYNWTINLERVPLEWPVDVSHAAGILLNADIKKNPLFDSSESLDKDELFELAERLLARKPIDPIEWFEEMPTRVRYSPEDFVWTSGNRLSLDIDAGLQVLYDWLTNICGIEPEETSLLNKAGRAYGLLAEEYARIGFINTEMRQRFLEIVDWLALLGEKGGAPGFRAIAMGAKPALLNQRKQHLKKSLHELYLLLKEYEDIVRLSDGKKRASALREIGTINGQISVVQAELDRLIACC